MRARLILWDILKINKEDLKDSYIVGVDRGALNAISQGINPNLSIGDFDSVSMDEFEIIKKNSKRIIKLNPIKDKTDTEEALIETKDFDDVMILGGIKGNRIEHFYANLGLLLKYPKVKLKDDHSLIEIKNCDFIPNLEYKYTSLFPIDEEAIISIEGMKYNLDHYHLRKDEPTLGCSNEIVSNPKIMVHEGRLIVISSKDDHENI